MTSAGTRVIVNLGEIYNIADAYIYSGRVLLKFEVTLSASTAPVAKFVVRNFYMECYGFKFNLKQLDFPEKSCCNCSKCL